MNKMVSEVLFQNKKRDWFKLSAEHDNDVDIDTYASDDKDLHDYVKYALANETGALFQLVLWKMNPNTLEWESNYALGSIFVDFSKNGETFFNTTVKVFLSDNGLGYIDVKTDEYGHLELQGEN